MMKNRNLFLVSSLLFAVTFGCKNSTEEVIDTSSKPSVAFDGKPDEKLAAKWKTQDGATTYTLNADGNYQLEGTVSTPGGKMVNKSSGQWSVKDDQVLIKGPAGTVVPYKYELEGKKLTLTSTGKLQSKTVLLKQ